MAQATPWLIDRGDLLAAVTLQYEIYFSDDQSECIVLERYRNSPRSSLETNPVAISQLRSELGVSEPLIEHAANLGEIGAAILAWPPVFCDRVRSMGTDIRRF